MFQIPPVCAAPLYLTNKPIDQLSSNVRIGIELFSNIENVFILFGSKRQSDMSFVNILNRIRFGCALACDVDYLNSFKLTYADKANGFNECAVHLFPMNKQVNRQNSLGLSVHEGESIRCIQIVI